MARHQSWAHYDDEHPPEHKESLFLLVAGPTIWTVHFLVSYIAAATWCGMVAGRDGPLTGARWIIAVATAIALAAIAFVALVGWRRHTMGTAEVPHDSDTPEDRHRFIGFATLLLAGLSFVGTIYVALAAVFLETCH
jgi:hypothetical protein